MSLCTTMDNAVPKKECILFLKALKTGETVDNDPYVKIFSGTRFCAVCISPISFEYHSLDLLHAALVAPSGHSGLILSSPRVVQALAESIHVHDTNSEWYVQLRHEWQMKPVFAIGKATASAAVQLLGLTPSGENSGNAKNLLPEIIDAVGAQSSPVLFPCGNLRRGTIPERLATEGIALNSITVYDTIPDPETEQNLKQLIDDDNVPEYCIYFSPSGVHYTYDIMKRLGYPMDNQMKFIAIGPTTERALLDAGLLVCAVADKPTPECIINLIKSITSHT